MDRCPEDRVVEVLEAVNLLMAYPLFVVIVGVDPRWVKNALIKKHQLHFTKGDEEDKKQLIDASSYLEKIFQVPFNLKAAEDTSVKNMIKSLLQSKTPITTATSTTAESDISKDDKTTTKPIKNQDLTEEEKLSNTDTKTTDTTKVKKQEHIETTESFKPIEFSEKEIELLQEMSIIVGPSPRAIKRFINIYRIVKAHENFGYTNDEDIHEMLAVMFLLALPIGKHKGLATSFFTYVTNIGQAKSTITYYFNNTTSNISDGLHTNLKTDLKEKIIASNIRDILNIKREVFTKHLTFIKRFAYTDF